MESTCAERTAISTNHGRFYIAWRCILDFVVALLLTPLALPVVLVAAAAIQIVSPGPVLFRQRRTGFLGRDFVMVKLRTMHVAGPGVSEGTERLTMDGDERVFPLGTLIRKHRIDEIPQLWHVLRGEMALIGPRPIPAGLARAVENERPEYRKRMELRPGLTGLAQVRLGYTNTIEGEIKKLLHDLEYSRTISPIVDLRILVETVRTILSGSGAR